MPLQRNLKFDNVVLGPLLYPIQITIWQEKVFWYPSNPCISPFILDMLIEGSVLFHVPAEGLGTALDHEAERNT